MVDGVVEGYRRVRWNVWSNVWRAVDAHPTLARLGAAFVMAAGLGVLAQVSLLTPLTPVPFTLQVLGVALAGGLLGPRWGAASTLLYLGLGLVGFPVFAMQVQHGHGWAEAYTHVHWFSGFGLFAPGPQVASSAGYLLGYPPAAYLSGWFVRRRTGLPTGPLLAGALVLVAFPVALALGDLYRASGDAGVFYPQTAAQRAYFGILLAAVLVILLAASWLLLTSKARRERIELFAGSVLGLAALYTTGALWFVWATGLKGGAWLDSWAGVDHLTPMTTLRLTVTPFVAVDVLKILAAVGLLTLARPSEREILARPRTAPGVPRV